MTAPKENSLVSSLDEQGPEDALRVVGNHTGYDTPGSENYEHDETGSMMNYSGIEDEMFSAEAEHDGWQEGYDF